MPRREISVYGMKTEEVQGMEYPTKLGYFRYGRTPFLPAKLKLKPKKSSEINGGKPIPKSLMKIPCERAIRWRKHLLRIGKKVDLDKEMDVPDEEVYLSDGVSKSPLLTRNGVPVAKKVYIKKRVSLKEEQEQILADKLKAVTGVRYVPREK